MMCATWRSFSAKEEKSRKPPYSKNVWLAVRNDRGHGIGWRVHGNPMIRKNQVGQRGYSRHVALRASLPGQRRLVTLGGMAFPAGGVIRRGPCLERGMRRVARQTRHAAAGGFEAVAGR